MSSAVLTQQGETLDTLAFRVYGQDSVALLPQLIDINPTLLPVAILPTHSMVVLPDQPVERTQRPTLKLWD